MNRRTMSIVFFLIALSSSNFAIASSSPTGSSTEWTTDEKWSVPVSCIVGGLQTGGLFILESSPITSVLAVVIAELSISDYDIGHASKDDGYKDTAFISSFAGGFVSIVLDGISMTLDITDGKIKDDIIDENYDMVFQITRHAYGATEATVDEYFIKDKKTCGKFIKSLKEVVGRHGEIRLN